MTLWVTASEAASLPGMPSSPRRAHTWFQRAGAPTVTEPVRGGQVIKYSVESLPVEARLHLASRQAAPAAQATAANALSIARAQHAGKSVRAARRVLVREAGTAAAANVTGTRAAERDDKARVLVHLQHFWASMGGQLSPAVQAFCEAWNAGLIDATPALRERFPTFTRWKTVLEWHQALQNHGGAGLTRPPAPNAGQFTALAGDVGQRTLALLHDYPHLGPVQLRRLLEADFARLPSERAFQRALAWWKAENAQLFSAVTNPDQWRSHYQSAAGSRSEAVLNLNDLWETDGTKGEVMLADGKRWTVTAVIDVYSSRMKVHLSASPRAAVVMGLMREAILEWGVPVAIKSDNGSDYTADQFELALMQLDIKHPLCDPFQPQQKPHIERGQGTMLRDLFELLPGYLGHNVAQRSDIEARKSFAERLMRGSGEGGPVELRLQPEQLQAMIDNWLERYHAREHSAERMQGLSPNQRVAAWAGTVHTIDERALDVFLAAANQGGTRTVGKKGIKLDNGWFNCAEIGGLEGQQVQVKQTEADLGTAYVFDLAGRYIGTALDHARLGVSAAEVAAERREHQKQVLARQKAELKAAVKATNPQQLVMNVLQKKADAAVDASPNVTRLRPTTEHTSDAIRSVVEAPVQANTISPAAAATLKRLEEGAPSASPVALRNTPQQRYSWAVRLRARMAAGEAIEASELRRFDAYVTTPEFKGHERVHQGQDPLAEATGGG